MTTEVAVDLSKSCVDLYFGVLGADSVPLDHGYALYSAICAATESTPGDSWLHASATTGLIPLRGIAGSDHRLHLRPDAEFGLRLDASDVPRALVLAGKRLRVGDADLRVCVPTARPLIPHGALHARIVTTRHGDDPERFDAELARQLETLGVHGRLSRGARRVIRIRDRKIVGHEVVVADLTDEDSIRVQACGIGGRRKMGCGVFFRSVKGGI